MPDALEFLSPNFAIDVSGTELDTGVTQLVSELIYESVDGIADMLKLVVSDPILEIREKKIFQPGNEISVWFGYGTELQHVGRGVIIKNKPKYPQNAMPSLQIVAYTKDHVMMDNEPDEGDNRAYADYLYSDIVTEIADRYQFETDIDDTEGEKAIIQKAGMSDYELVKGLSNITGYLFWVDGDEEGTWTLHFKNPEEALEQDHTYNFVYNQGDATTLLSFDPEMLIKGSRTKIRVETRNTLDGSRISEEFEEEASAQPELVFGGDPLEAMEEPNQSGSAVKVYLGEFSVEIVPTRRFKDSADALAWVAQWFRRVRNNFILAKGHTIGAELLMARQIHPLDGLGVVYNGEYYFNRVRHKFSKSGYTCDFDARKVLA